MRGGGGELEFLSWTNYLFHSLSAIDYFIYFTLVLEQIIYFTFSKKTACYFQTSRKGLSDFLVRMIHDKTNPYLNIAYFAPIRVFTLLQYIV